MQRTHSCNTDLMLICLRWYLCSSFTIWLSWVNLTTTLQIHVYEIQSFLIHWKSWNDALLNFNKQQFKIMRSEETGEVSTQLNIPPFSDYFLRRDSSLKTLISLEISGNTRWGCTICLQDVLPRSWRAAGRGRLTVVWWGLYLSFCKPLKSTVSKTYDTFNRFTIE